MVTRFLSTKDVAHVPKFDGTNFCNWKFQLFMVFDHFKVSNIVLGTEPLPRLLNTTSPAGVTTNNAVDIELWSDSDASARIAICGTLEAKWQNSLINCKTAEAMWKRLTSQFEQVAKEDQFQLIQRFFDYKYQSQLSVMDNITAIETIAAQLADINAPRSDADIITKILSFLPPIFAPVKRTWENLDDGRKTLQLLTKRLLKEELFLQESKGVFPEAAFFADQPGTSSQARRNVICDFCKRRGHVEDKCWKKQCQVGETQAKFAHSSGKLGPSSNPETQSWSGDYAFRCFMSNDSGPRDVNWLVDSGASQHMSDQRWAFIDYQPVRPGCWPVNGIGENRKPLQVHGYGSIPISSLVEGSWHAGILQDVLYVPQLGANLFSVLSAANKGFGVNFIGEKVEVVKGAKIVAVGASTASNLYRMSMVSGRGETKLLRPQETFAALAKPSLLPLRLWHQRLGHICISTIKKMAANNMANGLMISEEKQDHFCEGC